MVVSRAPTLVSKVGIAGTPVQLTGNFFRLEKKPSWSLFQYRIDFEPAIEIPGLRKRLIFLQKPVLGGYLYDGQSIIYLAHKLEADPLVVEAADREDNKFQISIKYTSVIEMNTRESLMVLNIILRRSMEGLKLQLLGRNFFDPVAKVNAANNTLQLWPGYITSIRQHEKDIMLCAEITHKVMRTETVYDILVSCRKEGPYFKDKFVEQVLGMTVLTDYNNKTYRVDDIDFNQKPSDTFESAKDPNKKISFIEYYKNRYQLNITDHGQPLLISKCKDKDIRGGKKDQLVALIPELCRATGLPEHVRKNFK